MIEARSAEEAAAAPPTEIPVVGDNGRLGVDGGRQVIARLADELLPVLIARLAASALGELEVRENGWRVRLRRPVQHDGLTAGDEPLPEGRPADATRAPGSVGLHLPSSSPDARPGGARGERPRTHVTSPAVGYFLPRDNIGPGSSVRNGDVLGHVDVLGVRQEVVAPIDGILASLEVEPGEAVEYGQPIARLDPDAREGRSESRR